jgi:hypothetical protein
MNIRQLIGKSTPGRADAARPRSWFLFLATLPALVLPACAPPGATPVRERSRITIVREKAGERRLKGIGPILGFARGRDSTFTHCLQLVLEATGRKIGYDELMGLSGLAFRTQFRVDRWDVGNPDPLVGESCLKALFSAIGWDCKLQVARRDRPPEVDALRRAIRQSIDQGWPVLAANIIPPEDWGIITAYRRDRTWLCRSYNGGAERADRPAAGWPTAVVLLTRRHPRPPAKQAHIASLRRAVELFEKRRSGQRALGQRAFDHWCESLRGIVDRHYFHPNFWTYIGLIDARAAAVRYLRSIRKEFGQRGLHIASAAQWYDKEVQLLLKGLRDVPCESDFPDSLPPFEMRERQINILRQAQSYERSAIASLKKAL